MAGLRFNKRILTIALLSGFACFILPIAYQVFLGAKVAARKTQYRNYVRHISALVREFGDHRNMLRSKLTLRDVPKGCITVVPANSTSIVGFETAVIVFARDDVDERKLLLNVKSSDLLDSCADKRLHTVVYLVGPSGAQSVVLCSSLIR